MMNPVATALRVGLVFVLALAFRACGTEQAGERIYVPGSFGQGGYGLRYKPTKLVYTGDGSDYVDHLHYLTYGGPRAIAVGTDQVNDCEPGCGGGTYHPVRARAIFWHLARCRGKRIYAMFKIDAPGARRYGKINPFTVDLRYMAACPVPSPTLGVVWAPSQKGWGQVAPTTIFNGGDPLGLLEHIRWRGWGSARAIGIGMGWRPPDNGDVSESEHLRAKVVAWNLGMCRGRLAYRAVTWFFPSYGEKFDGRPHDNMCTGEYVLPK